MLRKRIEVLESRPVVEVVQRPVGRYSRQITLNARGRCAICDCVADHVHKEGQD